MLDVVIVSTDESKQCSVPTAWRATLSTIVAAFKDGDFRLERGIEGVNVISADRATAIAHNIASCGLRLTDLPEESWQTSVCQWQRDYWDVLVDLFTIEEEASDLSMLVRVHQANTGYVFDVVSVYVA
ncbi:MAG: hypothetical protein JO142_01020 [Burkholderiales bacterium]|nr:hypothetical protein [Burkholderiales bacterium]